MKFYITFTLLSVFLLTGCLSGKQQALTPKQQNKEFKSLQEEIKNLPIQQKAQLYQSLHNEIKELQKEAKTAYNKAYLADAIKNYELINTYTSKELIPQKKLSNLQKKADLRAAKHYKNAKKLLAKNKKKALKELNSAMMNNPNYKDTNKLYKELHDQREIKIYLNDLESSLDEKLLNYNHTLKELLNIRKNLQELKKYDYKNPSVKTAELFLEKNAANYLHAIHTQEIQKNYLKIARKCFEEKKYSESQKYAQKVLLLDRKNIKAKKILTEIKIRREEIVLKYIQEGKKAYSNKNLQEALQYFQKALQIDKNNKDALIYHKKIQQQLQTIQSLQ